jgi:hypothetical protein
LAQVTITSIQVRPFGQCCSGLLDIWDYF